MTRFNRRQLAWLAAGSLAAGTASAADDGTRATGTGFLVASDSEGFDTRRVLLEYLPSYRGRDQLAGVRATATGYSIEGWERSARQVSAVYRSIDPATTDGVQGEAGYSRQGGHGLVTLDASWRGAMGPGRSIEAFANRDWVETRRALDAGVHATFAGVAVEQTAGAHVTLVGVAGYQDFSDGNTRKHGRAKLIVQPSLDLGLTLQARYRMFRSDAEGGPRSYFNPGRYSEAMFALGWRKRIDGWMGNLTAGVGRQRVGGDARTPTRLLEAGLESPARARQSLRLRAGLNKSASFGGPDYTYRYAQAEWLIGF
jgi:hypothetical protein